ncbi:MAG TPA: type II secretion system protein [Fimbriimonas sp.]|nr:type II secretion system protein [Fimbriimonas sp.]
MRSRELARELQIGGRLRGGGFSLVELLVTVLILGILCAAAIGNYLSSLETSRTNSANHNARMIATAVQANYMRLGAKSYLDVIDAGGNDQTGGQLANDLGGGVPNNPCKGSASLADYTITSTATSFQIVAGDPGGRCGNLKTFKLNGP